jgi:hypothetical protein
MIMNIKRVYVVCSNIFEFFDLPRVRSLKYSISDMLYLLLELLG